MYVKYICFLLSIILIILFLNPITSSAIDIKEKTINAKLASSEIEGDLTTVWSRKFAAFMKEETNGLFDLDVYPYGTLGSEMNINQLCQLGAVDFVYQGAAQLSAFVPDCDFMKIHYLFPRKDLDKIIKYLITNGDFYKLLTKAFKKRNLYPLAITFEGWQWITSKKPIIHFEDVRDIKIRVMNSKILIQQYKAYGFSPTTMDYGEIYSSLQTNILDAQIQPMFANYSMKFYEAAPFFTQMWATPYLGIIAANLNFFNSLPTNIQKKIEDFWVSATTESYKWIENRNKRDMKKIIKAKPEVKFYEFTNNDIEKAKKIIEEKIILDLSSIIEENAEKKYKILKNDIEKAKKIIEENKYQ